jgi:hypothetical protein
LYIGIAAFLLESSRILDGTAVPSRNSVWVVIPLGCKEPWGS